MSFTDVISRPDASGLIPVEQAREVIRVAGEQSIAMNLGRRTRMGRHQQQVPVLALLPEAFFVSEGGLKQTTKAAWEGLILTAEEIACLVPIHEATFRDTGIDLWSELREPIATAIGRKLDGAALLGVEKPASWPASILEGATAAGNVQDTGATVMQGGVFTDLERLLGHVEDDGFSPTDYVGAPRLKRRLRQARNTIGDLPAPTSTASVWDLPVSYTSLITGRNLAFTGDFKILVVGIREDINWTVSTDGVLTDEDGKVVLNLLQQDSIALRVVFRAAIAIANPATVENPDPDTRFPFAVLQDPESGEVNDVEPEPDSAAEAGAEAERERHQPRRHAGKR